MTNDEHTRGWLKEAQRALFDARQAAAGGRLVAQSQEAQQCVEYCAKCVIACFSAPVWTHFPGEQLRGIIRQNESSIRNRFGKGMLERLNTLSTEADAAGPWHGRSTYGIAEQGVVQSWPTELCTEEVAQWLLDLAERSFTTASDFINGWFGQNSSNVI